MSLTCLQIIQKACQRIGILTPNQAVGSTDPQIIQLLSIAEEEGEELQERYGWQGLQVEATFTTLAAETQGTLSSIAPGFEHIVNDTAWNRTLRRPLYGPLSEAEWQQQKAMQINGPFNAFRIQGDSIKLYPAPAAGQTCAFEYITRQWITKSVGGTSDVWTNDADTPLLDDRIVLLGTIWRWKAAKNLSYAEDFEKYERRVMDKMARDAGKATLSMTGETYEIRPAIMIPRGSW